VTRWSPEARVLARPAETFRALADEADGSTWTMIRRPLLLVFFCGCVVSLQASGRLSLRLITDGVISFAFIPIFEFLSFAIVYGRAPRRLPFAQAVDAFFVANAPWLLWMLIFIAIRSVQTPEQAIGWPTGWMWTVVWSLVPFAAWTVYIDVQFFRAISAPSSVAADVTIQRLISWFCIIGYFVGHELWEYFAEWARV
jgi:hypothetical protein